MSRRGHGITNVTGRKRHKLFKLIVPEPIAARAIARFKRAETKAKRQREIDAVRQILLIVYPNVQNARVCAANDWGVVAHQSILSGNDANGAAKLAARILDELYDVMA